jgi:hypothetical protein
LEPRDKIPWSRQVNWDSSGVDRPSQSPDSSIQTKVTPLEINKVNRVNRQSIPTPLDGGPPYETLRSGNSRVCID